jgi:glycogen phosphorylase
MMNQTNVWNPQWQGPVAGTETDLVLTMSRRIRDRLTYDVGARPERASPRDLFFAAALVVRDEIMDRWRESNDRVARTGAKLVCYFSLEFLIGRLLSDIIGNLDLTEIIRSALGTFAVDVDEVLAQEPDAALGNGGLGRLAACFMESLASVGVAAYGYGIRYEYGLFRQLIIDGNQQEIPEPWLMFANPWEIERTAVVYDVGFGGTVEITRNEDGFDSFTWKPEEVVRAVAYDTPVVGWRSEQVNTLRLWSARASEPLRLTDFNRGDHIGAVNNQGRAEAISRVLYPGDESPEGQMLRLRQEFFFASASLQDIIRRHVRVHGDLRSLDHHTAIQLNDTHPAIGIPELMRLLIDEHRFGWDDAWKLTRSTFSYTNHTLLPEALERWPVVLIQHLLPRHMQIIYEINRRHLTLVEERMERDPRLMASVSLIDENHDRRIRMGNLAFVGSHKINGVSTLHSDLVQRSLFADLDRVYPGRIVNKTNGITFRRWLHRANPGLTALLTEVLGERVLSEPACLAELAARADDAGLQEGLQRQRAANKDRLTAKIMSLIGVTVDPGALFDIHIKRIHEYKRQLLNILHTVAQYHAIIVDAGHDWVPRVKVFAGKAAAGYHTAKQIIRLIHDVATVVNNDPRVMDRLKVVFLPDYNVTLAEAIIPAADLSEQISTAGMEASGTGNMKLMLNGALTIGTLDGANVEIRNHVETENIFIFGLTAQQVETQRVAGLFNPEWVARSPALTGALDAIEAGAFSPDEPDRYRHLVESLRYHDTFMVTADFDDYCRAQEAAALAWTEPSSWWRKSIMNIAGAAWFSSDRTIREYATDIWNIIPRQASQSIPLEHASSRWCMCGRPLGCKRENENSDG